jgi:hypothetical protein
MTRVLGCHRLQRVLKFEVLQIDQRNRDNRRITTDEIASEIIISRGRK